MKFSKQFQLYESDHTKFIKALKQQNPELEQQQRDGRALLWDKAPIDLDTQKRNIDASVKQQAYVYQNKA
jgi:predicted phage tail protein